MISYLETLLPSVEKIRRELREQYLCKEFVTDKTGVRLIEIIGASFYVGSEDHIFGTPNDDYIQREIEWYNSQSRFVRDIPGGAPKIWEQVSNINGMINSNYGWCIYSNENGNQYLNVLNELISNPESRRAVMIYNRPSMHKDCNFLQMSDFICTNAVQYLIRDDCVNAVVQMRSNDAWAGFRNDLAWQRHVLEKLSSGLGYKAGGIIWNAGSLHVYERQFYLVHHYSETGITNITLDDFKTLYGNIKL